MTDIQGKTIMMELIGEVESYLPDMKGFLHTLIKDSSDTDVVNELHRMAHTIKGAASMVQLHELSDTAALMEQAIDGIIAGQKDWSRQLIDVMTDTVELISVYCVSVTNGKEDNNELYQKTFSAFGKINGDLSKISAEDDDSDLLDWEEDDSANDFFLQLSAEGDATDPDHEIVDLFDISDDAVGEINPQIRDKEKRLPEISALDLELQKIFDEEAEEHLENIGRLLNTLSFSVTGWIVISDEYREKLHSLRRSVHTLKGAAAVMGIEAVADWGHKFEDFLDWLHDESSGLSPDIIDVMLDGADILKKVSDNPAVDISSEINGIQYIFQTIMADSTVISAGIDVEKPEKEQSDVTKFAKDIVAEAANTASKTALQTSEKQDAASVRPARIKEKRKKTRRKTLRVETEKIDGVMGLLGDMTINLSGFENSGLFMQATLTEFETTLQRLIKIASSLEAGYELAAIPHLGAMGETDEDEFGVMDEFDPLEMDRYSELHILIRSLNEAVVDLDSIRDQTFEVHDSWHQDVEKQRRVLGEVQSTMKDIQMTQFSTLSNRLYKIVRESSRVTGKEVRLIIEGESIKMDTLVWDFLADPLMHMLRNAVDHGIEEKQQRRQLGKPEQATININCSRKGSRFILRLSDDGKGLDHEAIRKRALQLYPGTGVEKMDSKELANLVFKQGFSIKKQVTTMSGRGVGMDVVRHAIDRLNGSVEVISRPGKGTTFILSMPIIVAQLPVILVKFKTEKFAVPMHDVTRVFRLPEEESKQDSYTLEGETVPLLHPAEIMGLKSDDLPTMDAKGQEKDPLAFAVEVAGKRGVLVIDAMIGKMDVIFKSLGTHLKNVPCVAGATIMGDGTLVPILQTEDLLSREKMSSRIQEKQTDIETNKENKALTILIADDSISIRKVLANFITGQRWNPIVARDGVEAMEKIRENNPDLIILDIEMPRMNGFEVLQSLQVQSDYSDIPVLMLTSRSASKYRDKAANLGARGFVTKPFKEEDLISLITSLT